MRLTGLAAIALLLSGCRSAQQKAPSVFDPMTLGSAGIPLKKYFERKRSGPSPHMLHVCAVKISASIPNLSKQGEMMAERTLSSSGKISYEMKSYNGDNTIKKDVIGRYLSSEQETSEQSSIGITAENYRFKFKRRDSLGEHNVAVYELNPRKDLVGFFKGELWLDEDSGLPLRETGRLTHNPSVIFKTLDFTRDYAIKDDNVYLAKFDSEANTRVIGRVLLTMEFEAPKTLNDSGPKVAATSF